MLPNSEGNGDQTSHSMKFSFDLNDNVLLRTLARDNATVYPTPQIDKITPASGPISGATSVTIDGTRFFDTGFVRAQFNGVDWTDCTYVSLEQLVCESPVHTLEEHHHPERYVFNLTIDTPDVEQLHSNTNKSWVYYGPYDVSAITPASGPKSGRTVITARGAHMKALHQFPEETKTAVCRFNDMKAPLYAHEFPRLQKVDVFNPTYRNLTNFQIAVEVNTTQLRLQGWMNGNCSDVRVLDSGPTNATGQYVTAFVDHCPAEYDYQTSLLWVQLPAISARGNATLFVLYGGGLDALEMAEDEFWAATAPDPDVVFPDLYDDFSISDPSHWVHRGHSSQTMAYDYDEEEGTLEFSGFATPSSVLTRSIYRASKPFALELVVRNDDSQG